MSSPGTVRTWNGEEGWGVVDSADTPGGCWTHFSAVAVAGLRELSPGQRVEMEWENGDQDGYRFRARRVWPAGDEPATSVAMRSHESSAYRSDIVFRQDDESSG